jgi:hypothetical protein
MSVYILVAGLSGHLLSCFRSNLTTPGVCAANMGSGVLN